MNNYEQDTNVILKMTRVVHPDYVVNSISQFLKERDTKQNSHKHSVSGKRPTDTIPYLKTRLGNAKRALENAKDDALWTAYYTGRIELLEFIIEELSQAACATAKGWPAED